MPALLVLEALQHDLDARLVGVEHLDLLLGRPVSRGLHRQGIRPRQQMLDAREAFAVFAALLFIVRDFGIRVWLPSDRQAGCRSVQRFLLRYHRGDRDA